MGNENSSSGGGDGPSSKREAIANTAEQHVGSTAWAYDQRKDNFPANSHKCNKFIHDVVSEADASPLTGPGGRWPLTIKDLVDGDHTKHGWENMGPNVPWQRGDIIVEKRADYKEASGHGAIAVSATEVVGAGGKIVSKGDHGLKDASVIRYVGPEAKK